MQQNSSITNFNCKKTSSYRRYLAIYSFVLIILILFVFSINFYYDPANKLRNDSIYIVNLLQAGFNLENLTNFNFRKFPKEYIKRLKKRNDVVVLGSSLSQNISHESFPGKSFFNHYIPGVFLEDYLAIYGLYDEKRLPSQIILEINYTTLSNYVGKYCDEYVLYESYTRISGKLGLDTPLRDFERPDQCQNFNNITPLFSLEYFEYVLEFIRSNPRHKWYERLRFNPTKEFNPERHNSIKRFDGSFYERLKLLSLTRLQKEAQFVIKIRDSLDISEKAGDAFEVFIEELARKKIKTLIYIAPINPYAYDYITKNSPSTIKVINKSEIMIRNLSKKFRFTTIGGFDPKKSGAEVTDFVDIGHTRKAFIDRVFDPHKLQRLN